REELVVEQLVVDELETRLGQLRPDPEGKQAADEEEDERVDDVEDSDPLVIGRRQPFVEPGSVGGGGGRQRRGRHRSSLTGPSVCRTSGLDGSSTRSCRF